jgi:molybdate transport system substrate-binding protein
MFSKRGYMRFVGIVFLLAQSAVFAQPLFAQPLRIAAAADLQQALPELIKAFRQKHPNASVEAVYGSSGNFTAQIRGGAPFDVFFSADMRYPARLHEAGETTAKPRRYALGQLVLWIGKNPKTHLGADLSKATLAILTDTRVRRIAIANPLHAPYGERAQEALQASNLWDAVQKRLVLAENVAQAAQYAQTLNVDAAIISLSLALSPLMQQSGNYIRIDSALHKPLEQGVVVIKRSQHRALSEAFVDSVCSPEGASVLARYGFLP